MPTEVKLPELGDGIESGDILEIFVAEGDIIDAGQDIVEMETDKATVPVPSDIAGKVTKICVAEGDTVAIGGVLIEIEAESGAGSSAAPPQATPPAEITPEVEKVAVPTPEPIQEKAATPPPPAQTSPPAQTPPPPAAPATPPVGTTSPEPASPEPSTPAVAGEVIPAGPAIRRFAREVGVNLASVTGSGDGGRITRDDVLAVVRKSGSGSAPAAKASADPSSVVAKSAAPAKPRDVDQSLPGTPDTDDYGPVRIERMSKIRKTIAKQMNLSWSTVPRVTNFDDADVTELERLRQSSKEDYAAQGLKLTTMPFLIKAIATSLRKHSSLNAIIDSENEQIIYKDYVNIGIAVDTDNGLVVPVMPNVDQMGIPEITRSLASLAGKVRGGQFGVSDLRGGSFTLSNLGAIGGQYSTPIVNVPEVAILLVGRSRKQAVVMPDDSIQARLMMPLSLSYDHRLVDGATAGRFLNDVISYLQAPSRLLLAL